MVFAGSGTINTIFQHTCRISVPLSGKRSCRRDRGGGCCRSSSSSSSSRSKRSSSFYDTSLLRQNSCLCRVSQMDLGASSSDLKSNSGNTRSSFPHSPDLASLSRAGLTNAVLLANLMMPPNDRHEASSAEADSTVAGKPNDPLSPAELVEALEMVVKSRGHEPNPKQLAEILQEVAETALLAQFSSQQLALLTKDLGILCCEVPVPFLMQLVRQLGSHLVAFDIPQLANVGWALLRLMPIGDEQLREFLGVDTRWLHQYEAACEQQLTQLLQQKQQQQQQQPLRLPSGQQLANLLLVPAAVQQPFSSRCHQLFEEAMVVCRGRLCGMAVAQTLSCYVRLNVRLQPDFAEVLLSHFKEDLLLYDHEEITQVAVAAAIMQLRLPNEVLADLTERAQLLEAVKRADPADVVELQEALDCLAKSAVGFSTLQEGF